MEKKNIKCAGSYYVFNKSKTEFCENREKCEFYSNYKQYVENLTNVDYIPDLRFPNVYAFRNCHTMINQIFECQAV